MSAQLAVGLPSLNKFFQRINRRPNGVVHFGGQRPIGLARLGPLIHFQQEHPNQQQARRHIDRRFSRQICQRGSSGFDIPQEEVNLRSLQAAPVTLLGGQFAAGQIAPVVVERDAGGDAAGREDDDQEAFHGAQNIAYDR